MIVVAKVALSIEARAGDLGADCTRGGAQIDAGTAQDAWDRSDPIGVVESRLRARGLRTPLDERTRFVAERSEPELSLIGVIESLRFGTCARDTQMRVRWRVFDHLTEEVVLERHVDARAQLEPGRGPLEDRQPSRDLVEATRAAWADAVDRLAALPELTRAADPDGHAARIAALPPIEVPLVRGDGTGDAARDLEQLRASVVAIHTGAERGTGFLISAAGHVLTHRSVVSPGIPPRVVVGGRSVSARLVQIEPAHQVALLRVDPDGLPPPLSIARHAPGIGAPLYAVSTLNDDAMDRSVTRGVVSAVRQRRGIAFYQTDAALGPDASGAPVLDGRGQVVALAATRLVSSAGESLDIALLVPIHDALRALHVVADETDTDGSGSAVSQERGRGH